mgnify:CR=1 FL=1
MSVIRRVPWTVQPQFAAPINPQWLARGLTFLNLGNGLYWQKGGGWFGTPTVTGAPKLTPGKMGIGRGFGTTFGAGASDRVDAGVVAGSPTLQRSIITHFVLNGGGGGGLGRVFQDTTGAGNTNGDNAIYLASGGTNISYNHITSSTPGQWAVSTATPTGRWTSFGTSLDLSSVANAPVLYVDGASSAFSTSSTPLGTFNAAGTTLAWGNRPSDGLRNWDGLQGPTAFFDCILTPQEFRALNDNIWQIFAPLPRTIWAPAAAGGGSTGTLAYTNANDTSAASGTTTVTGTLARTNANDTSAASGATTVTGTLARTNANDTVAASGSVGGGVSGTLAYTNANDTVSASGTTTVTGTVARTNANDSVAASGWAGTITGTVSYTNANDAVAAAGSGGLSIAQYLGGAKRRKKRDDDEDNPQAEAVADVAPQSPKPTQKRKTLTLEQLIGVSAAEMLGDPLAEAVTLSRRRRQQRDEEMLLLM